MGGVLVRPIILTVCIYLCLVVAGQLSGLRMGYYLVLTLPAGVFLWQIRRLQAPVTPHIAFAMFKQHVYSGVAILIGIWIGTLNQTP